MSKEMAMLRTGSARYRPKKVTANPARIAATEPRVSVITCRRADFTFMFSLELL